MNRRQVSIERMPVASTSSMSKGGGAAARYLVRGINITGYNLNKADA
jgi:hypothetical protein